MKLIETLLEFLRIKERSFEPVQTNTLDADVNDIHMLAFNKTLSNCKKMDTDYIFCSSHQGVCSECAKYQCRVYCISGKDKRFPKLPNVVYQYGGFHKSCRHTFYPYLLGVTNKIQDCNLNEYDVFKHSNRPFIDDRTNTDKKYHEDYLLCLKKKHDTIQNKEIYNLLIDKLPALMPKSSGAFTKMKNQNTARYQEIVKAAHDLGIDI